MKKKRAAYISKEFSQKLVYHTLFTEEGEMVASAVTTEEENCAILWIVFVRREFRNKGYGSTLITQLQNRYIQIETQWTTLLGKKLMLSCGFDYAEGKPNGEDLVWVKGDKR